MGQFRTVIARANALARRAEAEIQERKSLELLSPANLGVVCLSFPFFGMSVALQVQVTGKARAVRCPRRRA